jgi:hypothetical protein
LFALLKEDRGSGRYGSKLFHRCSIRSVCFRWSSTLVWRLEHNQACANSLVRHSVHLSDLAWRFALDRSSDRTQSQFPASQSRLLGRNAPSDDNERAGKRHSQKSRNIKKVGRKNEGEEHILSDLSISVPILSASSLSTRLYRENGIGELTSMKFLSHSLSASASSASFIRTISTFSSSWSG